jgi:hypothetical protein
MSSSIPPKKKKIKTLLEILSNSKNNEEVENIINHIKKEKIKISELHNKAYFNIILNTVFTYYDINRDKETEELYNYLLQLIDTSVSS